MPLEERTSMRLAADGMPWNRQRSAHLNTARTTTQAGYQLADSMKRFNYLLGQTELFQHFVDLKRQREPEFAAMLDAQLAQKSGSKAKKASLVSCVGCSDISSR